MCAATVVTWLSGGKLSVERVSVWRESECVATMDCGGRVL